MRLYGGTRKRWRQPAPGRKAHGPCRACRRMVGAVTVMRRRLIALAAAYAIALQAVLASFVAFAATGAALPGRCTSAGPRGQRPRPAGHPAVCFACPACCGDGRLSGVFPAAVEVPVPCAE